MFDWGEGPTNSQLDQFIREGKLAAYIMGAGEFTPPRPHPQYGYNLWNRLIDYYRKLDENAPNRQAIRGTIAELFDNTSEMWTSVTLSRILRLDDIRPKVLEFLKHTALNEIPVLERHELLRWAKRMRITELENEWWVVRPNPGEDD